MNRILRQRTVKLFIALFATSFYVNAQMPVIHRDKFDDNSFGWYVGDKGEAKVHIVDGKYVFDAPEGGWMSFLSPHVDIEKDFSLEATFTQVDGVDNHGIGMLWGYDGETINHFTFSTNGFFRIVAGDKALGISEEWRKTDKVQPMGQANTLKIEQRKSNTYFYLNGKEVAHTAIIPWFGKKLGFITYAKMHLVIDDFVLSNDVHINLPENVELKVVKENMGTNVNTQYDELSPKITSNGKTLYFGRKRSPDNTGGITDPEDIWMTTSEDGETWARATNLGPSVNTAGANNLVSVSTDNNTFLFHVGDGFAFMHRTKEGWSERVNTGIHFKNESSFLEGALSSDGKAILFTATMVDNVYYKPKATERDIYVCLKNDDDTWTLPFNAGKTLNSAGDEYSPFLSADGRTLYFATDGRPGYGSIDVFMSKRKGDSWTNWTEPVNLGPGINTVGFDAYYTLAASGKHGYMVSNTNGHGLTDIIRFPLPKELRPDPVVLVSGKVLNARTMESVSAEIAFGDLKTGKEVGEARSNPITGDYHIALPAGTNYGFHAVAPGYMSVNENLELNDLKEYAELKKDLFLVPIEVGESIQLKNVFFVQSEAILKPESYPELDRLAQLMVDNPGVEIELGGHTENRGDARLNLKLSQERVKAVQKYLIGKGINKKRMTGKGYGGTKPIAPNDSDQNRQLNRRVEFKITKK